MSNLHYELSLTIPADAQQPVRGVETIAFDLRDASADLVLDFSPDRAGLLRSVASGDQAVVVRQVNGHLIVPAAALRSGRNQLSLMFDAGGASLNRNDDFLYTIFVPARAHLAFPCFDQPDLKARYRLMLDVPDTWATVANGAETARDGSVSGRTRVHFAETQPLPTYLFAFVAGKFEVETAVRNGRQIRMYHRETDAVKVARNRDAIFDLHAAALDWLEAYTDIPYAFGKFDVVLIPSFQFSGMEHAGAILYMPIHVAGANFSVGDGHAAQGHGEVDITAIETGLRGRFQFIVRKDMKLIWPRAETPTHWIVMGLHTDLDDALKIVQCVLS